MIEYFLLLQNFFTNHLRDGVTPHTFNVCVCGYVGFCGGGVDKRGDGVGVKFLGQKMWSKIEKMGRGNTRKDDSRLPL